MNFGINPTWIDNLLKIFAGQIVKTAVASADRVIPSLVAESVYLKFPPAKQFIILRPVRFPANVPLYTGAGQYAIAFDGELRISCYAQFQSDQEFRDNRMLTQTTGSLSQLILGVLQALQGYTAPLPNNAAASYLIEPMRIKYLEFDDKEIDKTSWAISRSLWEVKFNSSVSQSPS